MRKIGQLRIAKHELHRWLLVAESPDGGVYSFWFESDLDNSVTADSYGSGETLDEEIAYLDESDRVEVSQWIAIGDALPDCQPDWVSPVRVAGREIGKPRWGEFERLIDGEWVPLGPDNPPPKVEEAIRQAQDMAMGRTDEGAE